MKKMLISIAIGVFALLPTTAIYAHTLEQQDNYFEVNGDISHGIRANEATTYIPISVNVNDEISSNVVLEIKPYSLEDSRGLTNGKAINFNISGNFYKTSNDEIVSVYGLSESAEYNGNITSVTGNNSYHNSTLSKWSGTHRVSESTENSSEVDVQGFYTLLYNNIENNTAKIKMTVQKDGTYNITGDYYTSNVSK
ncbi:MAG: hypothetical protein ACK5NF_03395 [Bacilli bacterium]